MLRLFSRGSIAMCAAAGLLTAAPFARPAWARPQQPQTPPAPAPVSSPPISSRADAIVQEQAAKALTTKPYEKNGFERAIDLAEDLVIDPPPIYPWFGSIYPGGLFALGVGVRHPYGDTGLFNMYAGWSFRNYTGVGASLRLPELARGRVKFDVHGNFINAPSVAFYGIGQESPDDPTHFHYRPTTVGGTVTIAPAPHVSFGAGADYMDISTSRGSRNPTVEERFDLVAAPGLGVSPTYLLTRAFAAFDWRQSPGYTRSGGWYHAEWSDYSQQNDGPFSFRRLDAEVQQFVPIRRENQVFAFRGKVSTTYTSAGEQVPFYLMPDLGGGSDLRGYPSWRFRDRHSLLLTGEYRWMAGQFVDMALFVDAGKVTARRSDLDFTNLEPSYGIGVRFHAPQATVLRIELAKTREGLGLVFTAGPVF